MFTLYLLGEIALLGAIVISKFKTKNGVVESCIRIVPIAANFIYSLFTKATMPIKLALLSSLIADFAFLFLHDITLGIALYILVQTFYLVYLKKKKLKTIIFPFINIVLVLILGLKLIIFETILYAIIFIYNIYTVFKKNDKVKEFALLLLSICDISLLIKNVSDNKK